MILNWRRKRQEEFDDSGACIHEDILDSIELLQCNLIEFNWSLI